MAVIHRSAGGLRARAGASPRTVLGRPPVAPAPAAAPAPLDPRESLWLDALTARARRTWADRLADEEAALVPEEAAGFAARIGAMVDADREGILAGLTERLRAHAGPVLGAAGEAVAADARDYEDLAGRVGDFNTAMRLTDDIAAMVAHDRSAHGQLRDQGLRILDQAPLSDDGRTLLAQRFVTQLAQTHATAHIDEDPTAAHASLTAGVAGPQPPYEALSDEQRRQLTARAQSENARREELALRAEAQRLASPIDRRDSPEDAASAPHDPFNEFGPRWDPSDPLDLKAAVANGMENAAAGRAGVTSTVRGLIRRLGRPALDVEIAAIDWLEGKIGEHKDLLSGAAALSDLVTAIPWVFAETLGGINEVLDIDLGEGERRLSADDFADHLLREFERGVKHTDAHRLSIKAAGEWLEAKAFDLLERKIDDGTIDPEEAAIYVPAVAAVALFGLVRKRLHAGTGDPARDVEQVQQTVRKVGDVARLAQIRGLIPQYFREMRKVSGYRMVREQMEALKNGLRNQDFGRPLEREAYLAHKEKWPKERADLRKEWEKMTHMKWPSYSYWRRDNKTGEMKEYVVMFDAHHIIPQKNGGPHAWWNIVPARKGAHQRVVHGRDAALPEMQRREAAR